MGQIYEALQGGILGNRPHLTILEIGAADGEDTTKLVELFPRAKIYCFEPDPRNIYTLKRDGAERFVTLVEAAVSDTDGTAVFNLSGGSPPNLRVRGGPGWTYSSSLKNPTGVLKKFPWCKFEKTAKVRTVRLDTFIRDHNIERVDFIWADVQGAEDLMIAGGQQTLARTRYVYTEVSQEQKMYEGEIELEELRARMPGGADQWELTAHWQYDVLLRNRQFG